MKQQPSLQYEDYILEMLENAENLKFEGHFQGAVELLQKIIISEPKCAEAYEELGDNYLSLRELTKAKKALAQALKISPNSPNAHYLMGFLLSLEEKWEKSVEELEKADKMFPNHPEILRCLGWSFYNNNRKAQGIAVLERSLALNPSDPNILCDLGVCYMNSTQYDKAHTIFLKVINIDPDSEQAREYLRILDSIKKSFPSGRAKGPGKK